MLERVHVFREEANLVEELGRLQVREPTMQCRPQAGRQRPATGATPPSADDRGGLEQSLLLRGQRVDAGRQHRLHRGRDVEAVEGFERR